MNQPACNAWNAVPTLREVGTGREATGKTYLECIRMLNGFEKSLERRLPENERRWAVAKAAGKYGKPLNPEHRTPNTEHLSS